MNDDELIHLRKKIHAGQSLSRQETWKALDAITTLRTQLAAANARAEQAEQRVATLEAALAAQIEADARIAEDAWLDGVPVAEISAAIRAHSHDRSALDRMLAEASEKVLREAADMFDADSNIAQTILALIEADHAQP